MGEASGLKSELAAQKALLPDLRKHVQQAVDEFRVGSDQLHHKIMEDLDKERRDRQQSHGDLHSTVRDILDKDRKDREMHYSKVNSHFGNVQGDLSNLRDENKGLGGRLQDVEDKIHNTSNEEIQALELKL